jgi:ubiquinone/menaquinone biosynthesis C-methylase UbiE
MIIDKKGVLDGALPADLRIEVGCGPTKRYADSIGVDAIDYPTVDVVGDARDILDRLPAECAQLISSEHFFEHVDDVPAMLRSMTRVLKKGGTLRVVTPHFSNPFFYSDPTHRAYFGLYTFAYYADAAPFKRGVPKYCSIEGLENVSCHLTFKSYPPRYIRHGFKKIIEKIVNISNYTKELYEENFCYLFPCYEVEYILTRR